MTGIDLPELERIAGEWMGVPFRHLGDGKNGVDCAHLVGGILIGLGVLSEMESGRHYARDWYVHGREEMLLEGLERNLAAHGTAGFRGRFVHGGKPVPGDVLCMRLHSPACPYHHAAVVMPDAKSIVHSLDKLGVVRSPIGRWTEKPFAIFRLEKKWEST